MNASKTRRGAAKSNEITTTTNATEAPEVKTKETRGRKATTKAVSPPPTERPTRATRSSTRVTRRAAIEEAPEEQPSKPEVKPTRGRRGRPAAPKQTIPTEPETEKQPEPPKRGSRRKVSEPIEDKPPKEAKKEAEKAKPVKPATATTVTTTAAITTTTTTNTSNLTTTTSTTAKSTRGRGTKRSAAVVAAAAIESETADEDEAPKPKRATRGRTTIASTEKPASKPVRAGTRTSARGRKKEPSPEPETELAPKPIPAPVAEDKESEQVPENPKEEPVKSPPALEKIEEETDSMVANEKISPDPEILPTVVDVIEGIKEQIERTIVDDSVVEEVIPGIDNIKDRAADDASSIAETRDSLDVNLDNNSIRDLPDDELKSIDDRSSDDKSVDDNEKTIELGPSDEDQVASKVVSLGNGVYKGAGDFNNRSMNDTEDDIGLDETLPMESLPDPSKLIEMEIKDKNGVITKRKIEFFEEYEVEEEDSVVPDILNQKVVKRPRIDLLDIPTIPTVSGKVMTFGDDMCGELGLHETGLVKKRPVYVKDIDEPVVHLVSGGMHNVCLTSNGQVYTWGCNDEGALGRKTADIDDRDLSAEPSKVPLTSKIVKVSAGDSHSAALTSRGSVYLWGNFKDSNGKIGLTCDSVEGQIQPIEVRTACNATFVDLASGNDHLLLLTTTGEIYSLGVGEQGQLGRIAFEQMKEIKRKKEIFLKPLRIKFEEPTICDRIWAGQYSSFARSKSGEIYGWGLNNYSQLGTQSPVVGLDESVDLTVALPMRIPSLTQLQDAIVEQICPGQHFMLARDSKGRVYSCGRHEYGRLGHGQSDKSYDEPKLIESISNIKHIAAGSVTSFACSENGHLYAWGMSGAALGLGEEDAWTPTRVTSKTLETVKVLSVAAGSQHTAIIVQPKNQ